MSKVLLILKLLNKISRLTLPSRIYRPLKQYAQKIIRQRGRVSPYWLIKIAAQYILPYRFYLWGRAKILERIPLPKENNNIPGNNHFAAANDPNKVINSTLPVVPTEPSIFLAHKKSCRLVICCAFTGRYQVLAASIQESFHSKYASEVEWVLCGTTKEDSLFIETMQKNTNRVSGFICANNPLGRKWQNCISFAGQYYDAQLYAITGSDDIISAGLINYIIEREAYHETNEKEAQRPVLYATTNWLTMVTDQSNFASSQVFQCKILPSDYFQPIGAGRFYKGSFLKSIKFQIFDVNLERLLDDLGYYKIKKLNKPIQLYNVEEGALISVKGFWNQLNTVKDFFDAKTLELTEFSFKGYDVISKNCSPSTGDFLFRQNDLAQQLSFPARKELAALHMAV